MGLVLIVSSSPVVCRPFPVSCRPVSSSREPRADETIQLLFGARGGDSRGRGGPAVEGAGAAVDDALADRTRREGEAPGARPPPAGSPADHARRLALGHARAGGRLPRRLAPAPRTGP